jgi:hypothetical protein
MSLNQFKTEDTFLMIRNSKGELKHIPTKVHYSWEYEDEPVHVAFDTEKENEEYIERFNRGELVNAWLKVTVMALGETGTDTLGMCHVKA